MFVHYYTFLIQLKVKKLLGNIVVLECYVQIINGELKTLIDTVPMH